MQLDIFEHSRDVMLRNDVLQALALHDGAQARAVWETLRQEFPEDLSIPPLLQLIEAADVRARQSMRRQVFADHQALRSSRLALQELLAPAALSLIGQTGAADWLQPFWQDLVQSSAQLAFRADSEADHVVPMLLHLQDWQGAHDATLRIESWRRIPGPLAWMAQAKLHLYGLQASWALLAELAWLSPKRLYALIEASPDPTLQRLKDQFEAGFELEIDAASALADSESDLAWFPAWVLIERPQVVANLAQAQAAQHGAPEQAMRLLVNLLGLERQGRHNDIVQLRKDLRDLNLWLYREYMKTR
jgi:hypothetical protein